MIKLHPLSHQTPDILRKHRSLKYSFDHPHLKSVEPKADIFDSNIETIQENNSDRKSAIVKRVRKSAIRNLKKTISLINKDEFGLVSRHNRPKLPPRPKLRH